MIKISASLKRVGLCDSYVLSSISGAIFLAIDNQEYRSSYKEFRVGESITEDEAENLIESNKYKITVRK